MTVGSARHSPRPPRGLASHRCGRQQREPNHGGHRACKKPIAHLRPERPPILHRADPRFIAVLYNASTMRTALLLAITLLAPLEAADPSQPMFWSSSQQKDFDKSAFSKLNPERHLGTERMLDSAFVAYRNGNGEAEIHVKQADLLLIRSGEGTVLVGGQIVEGKPTGPDEIRGRSIEGGTKYPITTGDILYIPANTVHQFQVEPGKSFTAMVIKITPKP
jgi:mannose-6-phosphate isomerase-like protein (cupin superfamily)